MINYTRPSTGWHWRANVVLLQWLSDHNVNAVTVSTRRLVFKNNALLLKFKQKFDI